ncbi:uncharacterized protein CLUP02_14213 [Colletotrichum lupini]|uniref:Uncharacterized protein n=1 Tax=Colletotrichum lupini TaxID=145971 RepID=A0A9Q8WM54_9PEZI|nr:uncharacterized protein CLUP02_14213 [Colletotrichum lupini]UQC88688.1 hypothetical protein CLUP02_14213 [Colletotrichum lupini]
MQNGQYRHAAEMGVPDGSSRTILEFFVNKVAQVCDNRPFGSTITSLAIIQKPDKVQYIFSSNQRSSEDAQYAATTIQILLDKMGSRNRVDVGDDDRSSVFCELLRDILLFHKQRVTLYKSRLNQRLNQCIKELKARSLDAVVSLGDPLLDELEYLQALTKTEVPLDGSEGFARNGEHLILAANTFRKSLMYESVIERAREGRFNESERWCQLQHFIGRLSSYHGAIRAIISGRRRLHPDLFENFEITWLPPSIPMNNPMDTLQSHMGMETQQKRRSADNIIRKMMGNSADRDTTLEQAKTLQFSAKFCYCIIWIKAIAEITITSHIQVCPGHKNVYSNWTIPNLFANDLAEANERDSLLDKVVSKIREDALRALREKTTDGKRFDPDTHSSYPTHQSLETNADMDDFQSLSEEYRSIFLEAEGNETDEDDWAGYDHAEHSGGVSLQAFSNMLRGFCQQLNMRCIYYTS